MNEKDKKIGQRIGARKLRKYISMDFDGFYLTNLNIPEYFSTIFNFGINNIAYKILFTGSIFAKQKRQ